MTQQQRVAARRSWLVPVLVLAATAAAVSFILFDGPDEAPPSSQQETSPAADSDSPTEADSDGPVEVDQPEPDLSDVERRDPDDPLAIGPTDAPVTLVVFSDYQCPYCAQWSHETLPVMMDSVEEGELRIEWRDVNVYGEDSERAARASYAAGLQGQFWQYHDLLFPDGETLPTERLDEEGLTELAREQGLDVDQFLQDFSSEQVAQQIEANAESGLELGATSTPAFIVGGSPMVGAQPPENFVEALDHALESAEAETDDGSQG